MFCLFNHIPICSLDLAVLSNKGKGKVSSSWNNREPLIWGSNSWLTDMYRLQVLQVFCANHCSTLLPFASVLIVFHLVLKFMNQFKIAKLIVFIQGKFNANYRTSNVILHDSAVPLNPDHTHFIFVDDGYRIRYGGVAKIRSKLEQTISAPANGMWTTWHCILCYSIVFKLNCLKIIIDLNILEHFIYYFIINFRVRRFLPIFILKS